MGYDMKLDNLCVSFETSLGRVQAVKHVTALFQHNRITGIIGESGSGKSVMGMSILKLLPETAGITGSCDYKGNNLFLLPPGEMKSIRGKEIGLIPQNPTASLNPMFRIKKQLAEPLLIHGLDKKESAGLRVFQMLRQFGFENSKTIGRNYPFQMSGGMNQRIVSAMGLSCNPPWVIADEPTKALDAMIRNQVYDVFRTMYHQNHCGMMIITHDLTLAFHLCHEIKVMYAGEMIEQGPCKDLFEKPRHPYTKGLLGALPVNGMNPIPYENKNRPAGKSSCVFWQRCFEGNADCLHREMQDFEISPQRKVRCFRYAQGAACT